MASKKKILVVDDDEFNLEILSEYLMDDAYEVIVARDGVEALQRLEENIDLQVVVLDLMMPRMDGMGVLKRMKSDPRFQEIPVIMQTASAGNEQISNGLRAGVYRYLTKPYNDVTLLTVVKSALLDFARPMV